MPIKPSLPPAPAVCCIPVDPPAVVPINPPVVTPVDPPELPRTNPIQFVEKDCCGNFLIQEDQIKPIQLWAVGESIQVDLAQISIFNSSSSTGFLEVEITGAEPMNLQVYPGNTATFTGQNIRSIEIAARATSPVYIEGKYSVLSTFRVKDQ